MKLDEMIKKLYGSVDSMLNTTNAPLSRSYIYQIINGEKKNLSVDIAKELVKILNLNSIEELMEILEDDTIEEVQ